MGIAKKIGMSVFVLLFVIEALSFWVLYRSLVNDRATFILEQLKMRGENYATMLADDFTSEFLHHVAMMEQSAEIASIVVDAKNKEIQTKSHYVSQSMIQHVKADTRTFGTQSAVMEHRYSEAEWVCTVSPIQKNGKVQGYVYMFQSAQTINAAIQPLRSLMLVAFALCVVVSILLSGLLSHFVSKPILQLAQSAEHFIKGNYSIRFKRKRTDEVGIVMDHLDALGERLEHLENSRNDFLRGVAHEIRTPLTYIMGWNEVLSLKLKREQLFFEETEKIAHETVRMNLLVGDLLRTQYNQFSLYIVKKEVCLKEWTSKQHTRYAQACDARRIVFENETEAHSIVMDGVRMEQVLDNLIQNALRYGSQTLPTIVRFSTIENKFSVNVKSVEGCISTKELPYVFDRYFRSKNVRALPQQGFGLGLSIVKEVIEAHDGEVWAQSDCERRETIFGFELKISHE
ncbi:MAG: ATP-binding protein [Bacilli bacterium]